MYGVIHVAINYYKIYFFNMLNMYLLILYYFKISFSLVYSLYLNKTENTIL